MQSEAISETMHQGSAMNCLSMHELQFSSEAVRFAFLATDITWHLQVLIAIGSRDSIVSMSLKGFEKLKGDLSPISEA